MILYQLNAKRIWQRLLTIDVDVNAFRILEFGVRVLHDGEVFAGVHARHDVDGVRNVQ